MNEKWRSVLAVLAVVLFVGSSVLVLAPIPPGAAATFAPSPSIPTSAPPPVPVQVSYPSVANKNTSFCGLNENAPYCSSGDWFSVNLTTGHGHLMIIEITWYGPYGSTFTPHATDVTDTADSTWNLAVDQYPSGTAMGQLIWWAYQNDTTSKDTIKVGVHNSAQTSANGLFLDISGVDPYGGEPGPLDGSAQSTYSTDGNLDTLVLPVTTSVPGDTILSFVTSDSGVPFVSSGQEVGSATSSSVVAWAGAQSVPTSTLVNVSAEAVSYAGWPFILSTIAVRGELAVGAPSPASSAVDQNAAYTLRGNASGGSAAYTYTWYTGSSVGDCIGLGHSADHTGSSYSPSLSSVGTFYYCTAVSDGVGNTADPSAAASITVNPTLVKPTAPTLSRTKMDVGQNLYVNGTLPTTGTPTYAWTWYYSFNGGGFTAATGYCAVASGSHGSAGAAVSCQLTSGNPDTPGSYAFELSVTDSSAAGSETEVSNPSTVSVSSTLTPASTPVPSASAVDRDQQLWVNSTLPTTGASPYGYLWLVSWNGGTYVSTDCTGYTGSGSSGAALSCDYSGNTLSAGSYSWKLQITDAAGVTVTSDPSIKINLSSALTPPAAPVPSATSLDFPQPLNLTATIPTTGTAPYDFSWWSSINGGSSVPAPCSVPSGQGAAAGATETCFVPGGSLTVGANYTFSLFVNDSATRAESVTSPASSRITVYSALVWTGVLTVDNTSLDQGQTATISATLPTTGASPYRWQWFYSPNGSATYLPATTAECSVPSGTGGSVGATAVCSFATNLTTPLGSYSFELEVTDAAGATNTSSPSAPVAVASALVAPSPPMPSAASIDADQTLTVDGTIPTSGTPTMAYQWWMTQQLAGNETVTAPAPCTVPSGSGAALGAAVTCVVPAGTLSAGYSYTFTLEVNDSATVAESVVSAASSAVSVNSALLPPNRPTVDNTSLDQGQVATVGALLPTTGTAPYSWQWVYSTNGGTSFVAASVAECGQPTGTNGSAGATVTCRFATTTSTAVGSYLFELEVTDAVGASVSSNASAAIVLSAPLLAGTVSGPSYIGVGFTAALFAQATGGSQPLSFQWYSSANGSGACALGSMISGANSSTYGPRPTSTTYYCYTVTDAATLPQYNASAWFRITVLYPLSITESGLPGLVWQVNVTGPSGGNFTGTATIDSRSATLQVWVPAGSFDYTIVGVAGWHITTPATGGYAGTLTITTEAVEVSVTFSQVTYAVTFTETGLATGTPWAVQVNGTLHPGTGTTISLALPNGTESFVVPPVGAWHVLALSEASGSVVVDGQPLDLTAGFAYTLAVTFTQSLVPNGTTWTLRVNATGSTPASPGPTTSWVFVSSTSTIVIQLPNGSYAYSAQAPGHSPMNGSFAVAGQPISVSAATTTPSAGLAWWLWAAIAIVIVGVVAIVLVVVLRRRHRP